MKETLESQLETLKKDIKTTEDEELLAELLEEHENCLDSIFELEQEQ